MFKTFRTAIGGVWRLFISMDTGSSLDGALRWHLQQSEKYANVFQGPGQGGLAKYFKF